MNAIWYEPISDSLEDKLAVERANAFYMNWQASLFLIFRQNNEISSPVDILMVVELPIYTVELIFDAILTC